MVLIGLSYTVSYKIKFFRYILNKISLSRTEFVTYTRWDKLCCLGKKGHENSWKIPTPSMSSPLKSNIASALPIILLLIFKNLARRGRSYVVKNIPQIFSRICCCKLYLISPFRILHIMSPMKLLLRIWHGIKTQ